jgi:LPPG:FO 2-phospho-L-lactate transferase
VVLIAPSNPYVSIDPILSLPGVRAAIARKRVVAVSPIVAGQAVKGPLGEMIPVLAGRPATAAAVADHYGALLSGMVVHDGDSMGIESLAVCETDVIMREATDRARLARDTLVFAAGRA